MMSISGEWGHYHEYNGQRSHLQGLCGGFILHAWFGSLKSILYALRVYHSGLTQTIGGYSDKLRLKNKTTFKLASLVVH
jgi:hypothetical protein